jgi:hypothetical protein
MNRRTNNKCQAAKSFPCQTTSHREVLWAEDVRQWSICKKATEQTQETWEKAIKEEEFNIGDWK